MKQCNVKVDPATGRVSIEMEGGEGEQSISWKRALVWVGVMVVLGIFSMPVAYGAMTGDYSILKEYAETGRTLLEAAITWVSQHGK